METIVSLWRQTQVLHKQMQKAIEHKDIPAEVKGMLTILNVGIGEVWEELWKVNRDVEGMEEGYQKDLRRQAAKIKKLEDRISELENH